MKNMRTLLSISSISAVLTAVILWLSGTGISMAEDRTLEEFKKYAAGKLPSFSPAQLNALAKGVDKNGDKRISDTEFSGRLEVMRKIAATNKLPAEKNSDKKTEDTSKEKPVAIPSLTGSEKATVLLITGEEIAAAWKPFAKWKTRCGKLTKIITVEQIAQVYKAESIQEKIRLCVRDHIDHHGTRWVVLGGDSLPGGKGLVPGGHLTVHLQERQGIPTDIVYLSKTNWDADGDGIYGEWLGDRDAISYPDGSVGLGRIPIRTAADVAAFTDKVIAYESRYPTTDFARQMIYTCTDSPGYPKVRKSWDSYVSKVWKRGKVGRFFSKETPWDKKGQPGSYQLSAENLVELINGKTTSKLHIHGHGYQAAWVLEQSYFTSKHVSLLKNDGAYPLITTVSCNTGEFDSETDPSIVERMIRRPRGGSVAVVAPIRTGKPHFHKRSDFRLMVTEGKLDGTTMTMTRYWSNGVGAGLTTGEALMKAKADMAADARKTSGYHLCICELNLLGDPTLDMRADTPFAPNLKVPKKIEQGKQSIDIVTNAPGSTVCLWKGREVYSVVTADKTGKATLEVHPKTAGEILVSVSGPSLNSVTAKITVASEVKR